MFNLSHILYLVISAIATIGLLILFKFTVKKKNHKFLILKVFAILTVVLHFSTLYVDFFKTGIATVESPQLLPIYPCNIVMWLLLICAFIKNPENKVARTVLEFTFWAGIVCGIIGVVFNENYGNNPTLTDWSVFKGLLSHSTMIFGCLYILLAGLIKIRVRNCVSVFLGLCLFLLDGFIINSLYKIFKLGECNSMYLQELPFVNAPWLNVYTIGIFAIVLVFVLTILYEQLFVKKEERFTTLLKNKLKKEKK